MGITDSASLAGNELHGSCLYLPSTGIKDVHYCTLIFNIVAGDPNLRPLCSAGGWSGWAGWWAGVDIVRVAVLFQQVRCQRTFRQGLSGRVLSYMTGWAVQE